MGAAGTEGWGLAVGSRGLAGGPGSARPALRRRCAAELRAPGGLAGEPPGAQPEDRLPRIRLARGGRAARAPLCATSMCVTLPKSSPASTARFLLCGERGERTEGGRAAGTHHHPHRVLHRQQHLHPPVHRVLRLKHWEEGVRAREAWAGACGAPAKACGKAGSGGTSIFWTRGSVRLAMAKTWAERVRATRPVDQTSTSETPCDAHSLPSDVCHVSSSPDTL